MQGLGDLARMMLGRRGALPGLNLLLDAIQQLRCLVGESDDQPPPGASLADIFGQFAKRLRGALTQAFQPGPLHDSRLVGIQPGCELGHGLVDQRALGITQPQTRRHHGLAKILQLRRQLGDRFH